MSNKMLDIIMILVVACIIVAMAALPFLMIWLRTLVQA